MNPPNPTIRRSSKLVMLPVVIAVLQASAAQLPNLETGVDQIQLHPALRIERVASEPVVMDPVDLQFDEHGVAYVVEMGGYPFASEEEAEYPGNLVIIEDTNDDGVYDRRIVFAERFQYADSILPYRGGILVASPPDLLWLRDTDGDQRADVREVLISGFSVGNSQHNYNGLVYGLDNWVYAGNGGNSGTIYWPDRPEETYPIRHRDMKFDLVDRRIEFFGRTTTGFNVAIDDWGRIFTTHNLRHVNHHVFRNRYVERSPYLSPRDNPDISDHKTGDLDRIYAIGVQEARVNHPEQSGYFSCSCGITFYGGGAFPEEFNGNLFVADSVLNLVHRDVLRPDGPGFLAGRAREKVEFLASADRRSRPVNMRVGPAGALYLVDFYRPVIEHPEWIPDDLEKDMDLYAGTNQGRIYRIEPKTGLQRVRPRFDRNDIDSVVAALAHPNKWWRDTAQRLLVWWNDPRALAPLVRLARERPNPKARLHALWTLHGMKSRSATTTEVVHGCLDEAPILQALADPHPGVRENALVLAEFGLADAPRRIDAILRMANDPDARVRMQVALTLGELPWANDSVLADSVRRALMEILKRDLDYEWSRFAVLTTASQDPLSILRSCLGAFSASETVSGSNSSPAGALAFLSELGELIGAGAADTVVASTLGVVGPNLPVDQTQRTAVLSGLNTGLSRRRGLQLAAPARKQVEAALESLQKNASTGQLALVWKLREQFGLPIGSDQQTRFEAATRIVADKAALEAERLAQLELLGFSPFASRRELLFGLLDFRQPRALQLAALAQLTRSRDTAVAARLIELWPTLSREARTRASDFLIYRADNHDLLLTALEEEILLMGQLNLDLERRRRLLRASDEQTRTRAEALFSDAGVVTRAEAMERMKPALELIGDPSKGSTVYTNLCAECHVIGGQGSSVGPDLTEIYRKGAETLMHDILDPNAAVNTEYLNYVIDDDEGETFTGIIIAESDTEITLRAAGGVETAIRREWIESMRSSGLSLMPEELESGLTPQDLADLLAYLQQVR